MRRNRAGINKMLKMFVICGTLLLAFNSSLAYAAVGSDKLAGLKDKIKDESLLNQFIFPWSNDAGGRCDASIAANQCSEICADQQAGENSLSGTMPSEKLNNSVAVSVDPDPAAKEVQAVKKAVQAPKEKVARGVPGVRFTNDPKKISCHLKEKNHPGKSSRKGKHYDEDCCIDYDEWLEPGCTYLYSDWGISMNSKKPAPAFKLKK